MKTKQKNQQQPDEGGEEDTCRAKLKDKARAQKAKPKANNQKKMNEKPICWILTTFYLQYGRSV